MSETNSNIPLSASINLSMPLGALNFILKALDESSLPYKEVKQVSALLYEQAVKGVEEYVQSQKEVTEFSSKDSE